MQLLYLLESIRNPVCDFFFSLITYMGDEIFFLAVALVFFWCINKRKGYYILITGLVGTMINQALKITFKIPRPERLAADAGRKFTIVESAREAATGYSFPSGHTQNIAGTFGSIALSFKSKLIRITSIVVILLVAFSRMYLGVHTPWDVLASLGIAAALVFGLYPFFKDEARFKRFMPYIVFASFLFAVGLLLYVNFAPSKPNYENASYESAIENAYTLFGCTLGLVLVYTVDSLYINFDTRAPWYAQALKLALGLGIVIGIKAGLKTPLVTLLGNEYTARAIRYFIVVVFAGIIWPLTFKLFAKMRIKCLDSFGVWFLCLFSKSYKARVEEERKMLKKLNTPYHMRRKKKKKKSRK